METGKYEQATERVEELGRRAALDPELALEAARALRATGDRDEAAELMERAVRFEGPRPSKGNSRATVAVAELLLEHRVDVKLVLDRLLDPAKKVDPEGRAPYLALGKLALASHDRQLAAEGFPGRPAELRIARWGDPPPAEVDHAVHCAGVLFARHRDEYFRVNVEETLAVLTRLPAPVRLIVLSSQSAGGPTPAGKIARTAADTASITHSTASFVSRSSLSTMKTQSPRAARTPALMATCLPPFSCSSTVT